MAQWAIFADYDEGKVEALLKRQSRLEAIRVWIRHDLTRPDVWLNVIARRVS